MLIYKRVTSTRYCHIGAIRHSLPIATEYYIIFGTSLSSINTIQTKFLPFAQFKGLFFSVFDHFNTVLMHQRVIPNNFEAFSAVISAIFSSGTHLMSASSARVKLIRPE